MISTVVLLSLDPPDFVVLDVRGRQHSTTVQAAAEPAAQRAGHQITRTLTHLPATVTRIEVTSGVRRLLELDARTTTFTLAEQDLAEVLGQREFRVTLYDTQGRQLREFVRNTAFL